MTTPDEPMLSEKHLVEMLTLAGEFCINLEKADLFEKSDLIHFLSRISPILYLQGLLFPVLPEPEEEGNERFVTEEQWEGVFNTLRTKLGEEDRYSFVEPISGENGEVSAGSLSELFADVYQDMKDFAWLMTKNTAASRVHASFNIKHYFLSNWGAKLLQAQNILHSRYIAIREEGDEYLDTGKFN